MIIRGARSSEVSTLAALGVIAWEQAFSNAGENTESIQQNAEATYSHFCTNFWHTIQVAELDGEIVGWGALEIGRNNLTDLWILPVIQRQGVGSAILAALEAYAQHLGFEDLELETHAKNVAAIAFFKKHDFAISGLKSTYSASLDRSIDILQMRKLFE